MSTEPMECEIEAETVSISPELPTQSVVELDLPYRISVEHCYSRLIPFRSSPVPGSTDQAASFQTCVLFENCVRDKSKLKCLNRKQCGYKEEEEVTCNGFVDNERYVVYNFKYIT